MTYSTTKLQEKLQETYGLECKVYPLGQEVTFFGTELQCFKLGYKLNHHTYSVAYSTNLNTWYVNFPTWFTKEFSQNIKEEE